MILLGSKVKDKVTGFEGIAVSRIEYLSGCVQYGVRPRYDEEEMKGKYPEVEYIDEGQLEDIPGETVWIDKLSEETASGDKTAVEKSPPGGLQSARPRR